MSAYATAYQALTAGKALHPDEAARLLADLRKETGAELADAIEQQLSGKYRRTPTDTDAAFRKKKAQYGASMRAIAAIRRLAAAPFRPNIPHQRDNRSTS